MTIMAPGAGLPLHFHDTEECITCVEGVATAEIDGEQLTLQPFDHVWIPEGAHHRFWNDGETQMRIVWTYGKPGSEPDVRGHGPDGAAYVGGRRGGSALAGLGTIRPRVWRPLARKTLTLSVGRGNMTDGRGLAGAGGGGEVEDG